MEEKEKDFPHFRCIEGNALLLDWSPYLPCDKLVGNIPYNISRPLLYKIFSHRRDIDLAVLMVQKEFAEKIIARPGDPSYGVVSVLSQLFCKTNYHFNVPPEVFSPPPHVMSACITLVFRSFDIDDARLLNIVHSAFQQRRKTLQNSLHMYYSPELRTDFPWKERADTIPPEEYLRLLSILSAEH
ncbi:MAG: rRNA adenine dimethyltransferase family protein [Candidatus Marinimicrobia bacterium]|nr:rRNA adenine dimethyltransferase family protein [Candidatus Neomarinimicrobiota bacterium]